MKVIHEMRWWNALSAVGALSAFGFTLWLAAKRYPDILPLPDKYFRVTGEVLIAAGLAFGLVYIFARLSSYVSVKLQEADRLGRENEKLKEALRCLDLRGAEAHIARAKALWGKAVNIDPPACTYEDDPVFLQIAVDPSLRKVLSQPIVQRLNVNVRI